MTTKPKTLTSRNLFVPRGIAQVALHIVREAPLPYHDEGGFPLCDTPEKVPASMLIAWARQNARANREERLAREYYRIRLAHPRLSHDAVLALARISCAIDRAVWGQTLATLAFFAAILALAFGILFLL